MKKYLFIVFAFLLMVNIAIASPDGTSSQDLKAMTTWMADKMEFTEEQLALLETLNEKYPGEDFNKRPYWDGFRKILTDTQKAQLKEMKEQFEKENAETEED